MMEKFSTINQPAHELTEDKTKEYKYAKSPAKILNPYLSALMTLRCDGLTYGTSFSATRTSLISLDLLLEISDSTHTHEKGGSTTQIKHSK
jgi:hypothetical protein